MSWIGTSPLGVMVTGVTEIATGARGGKVGVKSFALTYSSNDGLTVSTDWPSAFAASSTASGWWSYE